MYTIYYIHIYIEKSIQKIGYFQFNMQMKNMSVFFNTETYRPGLFAHKHIHNVTSHYIC